MARYAEHLEASGLWMQEIVCQKLGRPPLRQAELSQWEEVAAQMLALPRLRAWLDGLSELELDLLAMATFSANGATDRELLDYARRRGADRNEAQEALYTLARCGMVFCSRGWSNEIAFVVPDDVARRLIALRQQERPPLLELAAEPPRTYVAEEMALLRDIYTFLTLVEKEPLQLTQQTGLIYKRSLEKAILPKLEVAERAPADGSYPPRFSFLFDFCTASQLLLKTRDGKLVVSPAAARWFALDPVRQAEKLFGFWEHRCLKASWRYEQRILVRSLMTCVPEVWYSVASLMPLIQTWFGKAATPPTDSLKLLAHQSLLDLELEGHQPRSVRLTSLGARVLGATRGVQGDEVLESDHAPPITRTFFLQPNYEVLVPRTLDLAIRYRLDQIADLTRSDTISRYRITDSSVQRGMERGWEATEVLDFLAAHSETPLPQNVQMTIQDWAERYGRITFWDVFLMRVVDKALARELKAHPAIAPFLRGEVAPTALIVARKDHPKLVEALKQYGYWPKMGILSPEGEDAASKPRARDVVVLDFGASHKLPVAINQQIPKPTGSRRTGPLRKRERGGRDLPSSEIETLVLNAISEQKQLEIEYFAPATGRTRRTIDPRTLAGDQIEAFCHLRAEERRFTLANILEIWVLE